MHPSNIMACAHPTFHREVIAIQDVNGNAISAEVMQICDECSERVAITVPSAELTT